MPREVAWSDGGWPQASIPAVPLTPLQATWAINQAITIDTSPVRCHQGGVVDAPAVRRATAAPRLAAFCPRTEVRSRRGHPLWVPWKKGNPWTGLSQQAGKRLPRPMRSRSHLHRLLGPA